MSKHANNDNIRNDIYENLPCQAMYNDSVRKMQQQKSVQAATAAGSGITGATGGALSQQLLLNNISNQNANSIGNATTTSLTTNNCNSTDNKKHPQGAIGNMPKEMLYATPLRKSDRYKSGERSRYTAGGGGLTNTVPAHDAKLSNLRDSNRMACARNGNAVQITDLDDDDDVDGAAIGEGCASTSALVGGSMYTNQPTSLPPLPSSGTPNQQLEDRRILNFLKDTSQLHKKLEVSGGRDCPNASFSNLAREEHFANLVQQNFPLELAQANGGDNGLIIANSSAPEEDGIECLGAVGKSQPAAADTDENLEAMMQRKLSPDKEVNGLVVPLEQPLQASNRIVSPVYIHREWVLKKIALCLEQRTAGKKAMPGLLGAAKGEALGASGSSYVSARAKAAAISTSSYNGCLVLGSNGSGKTSICQAIMKGNSGTKGILNRKLLACYLIESQNPECHSLSLFIRKVVLQLLSHASLINKDESQKIIDEGFSFLQEEVQQQESKLDEAMHNITLAENAEDLLIEELKRGASELDTKELDNFQTRRTSTSNKQKSSLTRQQSEPAPAATVEESVENVDKANNYGTHPPKRGHKEREEQDKDKGSEKEQKQALEKETPSQSAKSSPSGKSKSKIPVKRGRSSGLSSPAKVITATAITSNGQAIQQGGGEDIAEMVSEQLKSEIEAAINEDEDKEACEEKHKTDEATSEMATKDNEDQPEADKDFAEKQTSNEEEAKKEAIGNNESQEDTEPSLEKPIPREAQALSSPKHDALPPTPGQKPRIHTNTLPPPLPKTKSCRTVIADGYYELLLSNPEILECLSVDNIEKNPDECFKKALLFPLLELTPPKTALLLLIDSIDENYINEGNLITTLKGGRGTATNHKSRNVAELLSNHIHLFPKWLFLVCTTKKQTKQITKMFTGFKKITLDDLRKSHVVKDVQEYIINRLNSDFKDSIMLTKEIIESLHQLYIKSNGCILYLEKVLNGIKENFFSFREIKLIPCTLNGLYLYICQKSFNKKQYMKIRPVLNILLASSGYVDKLFLFNCLRTHNYTIDCAEFEKRLQLMRNILAYDSNAQRLKIFHNSFSDWLVDVKFATKKFICDVNEGHVMISMYYLLVADTLCANSVRRFAYHLIKSGEFLNSRNVDLDLILILLESRVNLSDCFYTNHLNCCASCEHDFKYDPNFLAKTRSMVEKFLTNDLSDEFSQFLYDFFKPSLPTDAKTLKLLIETGINNAETQNSCESSLMSPELSDKSQNIDFELADLLLSSEKSCILETQRATSPSEKSEPHHESQDENASSTLHQLSDSNHIELHKGKALIHILANDGNHQLLERALNACKSPIDLEIEDYNGQTALNIAARNGHLEIVKLLLSFAQPCNDGTGRMKRVDVNHADRDGWTPLRSASWGGHTEVVKLLIAQPACKIDLADKEGRTALRAAAWSGHEDILKILIESGADVNSVDRQGRTSLIAASYMGHYDIVEILLDNGANVNHLDLDGRSALCVAALCGSSGYSKVISTLLDHGANTDQLDNDGMSPLLVSSFEGNAEVCELLLENGADPDLADFMGRTPLWAACTAGHANVVKLLLFWGCGIDCMDSEGRTVLSIAAAQGNVETVRQLLDRGLDETHRDNAGWTPLHYAAFEGFHEVCVQLLESGAKIDECDNEGKTALHLAAQEGRLRCVQVLLDIHSTFVDQKAHDGKTAFRLACLEGHLETVEFLLKFCCDVNSKDADSRTTLYILALENKLDIVKYLLDMTNVDVNIPDSEGRTALHVAAWQGHVDMVKLLITLGNADVNSMDLEARTPLHSCAWQGNHDVMNILLYFGAVADHACKQGATALGISAQEGHEKCVIALLQYGANPYKSDHCGRTPIKLAAKSSRTSILKIFENYTKNEANNPIESKFHPSMLRSPDQPPALPLHQNLALQPVPYPAHASASSVCSAATTATVHNGNNLQALNASTSTHSSNNFYQNTMQSDASSLHKRKSVISSQSTGSSNDQAPLTFTQQLQRQSKLSSRNNPFVQNAPMVSSKHGGAAASTSAASTSGHKSGGVSHQRHSQVLPDLSEHQLASNMTNDADLYDMECMSPLYATPPHSPSSELSSPGQLPALNAFVDDERAGASGGKPALPDNHFARDTHMRIILGNLKENQPSSSSKSKRSGGSTNPAMRLIRSRFDSAAQLIRRTNNILSSSSNQGSSSIGVKSGTFQWRKESQM
ncbi:ankyrin repeat domain-containing protein 50 isoform X2 [Scaptodrosophila lebanonensis]|uniref:Ankyrin repeat domain-containing protein 50 isoform X2 n=1 Tax=Drosophila lebanonensis TaxID=7225 RepID=A0A6J2T6P6_DROLE|nr:ankyrin repeat domain-containing protein 50 isoform X2 [Scaptodrosophila lebanonensis]